jgi:hypothetical protein
LHRLRPRGLEQQREEHAYAVEAHRIAARLREVFDAWLNLREVESDYAQLANSAAVYRWDLMRLASQAERLQPPRSLAATQRELHNAVVGAARACQLLANGYRFHKTEAVCDGQALLIETVAVISELVDQLETRG